MKKYILLLLFLTVGSLLFADITATIESVSGKVELKAPGGVWKKASSGMTIKTGYSISTGFRSEATLLLGESQVLVKQLTRMELNELVEKEGTLKTGLNLRIGKIRAEVKTTSGLKQNFRITSPISTASVRGTSFEFDGENLRVFEGTVAFANKLGQQRLISAGNESRILGTDLPKSGKELKAILTDINSSTLKITQEIDISAINDILSNFTDITIIIN